MGVLIQNLIQQFVDVHVGKLWVGDNLTSQLAEVNEDSAFIRPLPELYSVGEIISHLTVWRRETIIKLRTGAGSLTKDAPINWLPVEKLQRKGWERLVIEFHASLQELIELIKCKDDLFLEEMYYDAQFQGYYSYRFALQGMLHHDMYHLGQLELVVSALGQRGTLQKEARA